MTTSTDAEPVIPEEAQAEWAELLEIVARRQTALDEAEQLSARSRVLVPSLLRKGVRREDLVGRPFSSAWLTKIQRQEGLTRRRRSKP